MSDLKFIEIEVTKDTKLDPDKEYQVSPPHDIYDKEYEIGKWYDIERVGRPNYTFEIGSMHSLLFDSAHLQGESWLLREVVREPTPVHAERHQRGNWNLSGDEKIQSVTPAGVSDGSTADYYKLPLGCYELQHLISYKNLNAQIGEILRTCYRYGEASHSDQLREAKKIKFYAEAEIERLEKYGNSRS
jgi:hypothetical protein